jgi:hypothetical protein
MGYREAGTGWAVCPYGLAEQTSNALLNTSNLLKSNYLERSTYPTSLHARGRKYPVLNTNEQ